MIVIDRTSSKQVAEQLADQLRYQVASGHYRTGDTLPSTRKLGEQISISFHSVRKAYQELEREGLLESRKGSGYVVKERIPLSKAERIEQGASLVQGALQKLIGLGLESSEIEYLFQEQLELVDAVEATKVVYAGSCLELATLGAQQIAFFIQQQVEACTFEDLPRHKDASFIITPFDLLQDAMEHAPGNDVLGVNTYLRHEALEHTSRLLPHQTVGVATRFMETIQPLTAQLRRESGFNGQLLAISLERSGSDLDTFADGVDVLVYTPECHRHLFQILSRKHPNAVIMPIIGRDSLDILRSRVGG